MKISNEVKVGAGIAAVAAAIWYLRKKKVGDNLDVQLVNVKDFDATLLGLKLTLVLNLVNPRSVQLKIKYPYFKFYVDQLITDAQGRSITSSNYLGQSQVKNELIPLLPNSEIQRDFPVTISTMGGLSLLIKAIMEKEEGYDLRIEIYTGIEATDLPKIEYVIPIKDGALTTPKLSP